MTIDSFFEGYEDSRPLFDALLAAIESLGPTDVAVSKSQIAFRHDSPFAWAWVPDRYLHGRHAPLVLSLALQRRDASGRWKEIVEPAPGRYMHHLELFDEREIDDEVLGWIAEARDVASHSERRS